MTAKLASLFPVKCGILTNIKRGIQLENIVHNITGQTGYKTVASMLDLSTTKTIIHHGKKHSTKIPTSILYVSSENDTIGASKFLEQNKDKLQTIATAQICLKHVTPHFTRTRTQKRTISLYQISNVHRHFIDLRTVVLLNISQDLDVVTFNEVYCNTLQKK